MHHNDVKFFQPRYGVSGYPTLKFFPKGNKAGEDYDGGRDVDDFVNFINEKCGTSRDSKGQFTSKVSQKLNKVINYNIITLFCPCLLTYLCTSWQ